MMVFGWMLCIFIIGERKNYTVYRPHVHFFFPIIVSHIPTHIGVRAENDKKDFDFHRTFSRILLVTSFDQIHSN